MRGTFKQSIKSFNNHNVKTKLETTSAEVANKCFKKALFLFTLAFPNIEDTEQAYMESEEGRLDFDTKLKEMEAKLEAKLEDRLRQIEKRQEQIEADLLKIQTSTFKIPPGDGEPLVIHDVKFVSSSLLLVANVRMYCVKLFNIEGQELDTLECQSQPWSLAILSKKAPNCWSVAVALPDDFTIALLEINNHTLSMKSVSKTKQQYKQYKKIAAVSSTTLAAGYGRGVDLIDLTGEMLQSISPHVCPWCMVTTEDQCIIGLSPNSFYKFHLQQRAKDFERIIDEIVFPRSMARVQSGCLVVADDDKKTLHLVGKDGEYERILWKRPRGGDDDDYLCFVTIHNNVCVCCTVKGFVYVFNIQGDQIQ